MNSRELPSPSGCKIDMPTAQMLVLGGLGRVASRLKRPTSLP